MKITVHSVSLEELKGTAPKAGWGVRAGKLLVQRRQSAFPVGSWSLRSGTLRQGTKQGCSVQEVPVVSGQVGIHQWCIPCHSGPSHTKSSLPESPNVAGLGLFAVQCSLLRGLGAQLRKHVVCCERSDCSRLHACCLAENVSHRTGFPHEPGMESV